MSLIGNRMFAYCDGRMFTPYNIIDEVVSATNPRSLHPNLSSDAISKIRDNALDQIAQAMANYGWEETTELKYGNDGTKELLHVIWDQGVNRRIQIMMNKIGVLS